MQDVIIIGGGVIGCSTALHLALRGVKRVTLLEKGAQVAVGASGASGGIVRMHYTVPADARLAWRSLHLWQHWADWVGGPSPFVNSGFCVLVSPVDIEPLKANVKMLQQLGIDTQVISAEELRELAPDVDTSDLGGIAYEPQSGYAYPVDATQALATRARELGVDIRLNTQVRRLLSQSGKVSGVELDEGPLYADAVVLAAGAWSGLLAQTAGLELPLIPKRVMAANIQRPNGFHRHPVFIDRATGMYTRNDRNERNLFGLEPTLPVEPDSAAASEVPAGVLEAGTSMLVQRLPAMARGAGAFGWAAPDGYGKDGHALLGRAPELEGLYLATGGSGTSFKTAPAIGEAIAGLIVDGRAQHVDLTPFRVTRFAENQPLVGLHEYSQRMVGEEEEVYAHG
jgi:sarcosine oxidase, subunit beta